VSTTKEVCTQKKLATKEVCTWKSFGDAPWCDIPQNKFCSNKIPHHIFDAAQLLLTCVCLIDGCLSGEKSGDSDTHKEHHTTL